MTIPKSTEVVVVGAGCFGLSTAYHLLKRGFTHVTVLDRSPELPAPEAASTDINKIVRSSYADPFYAGLARDAIAAWKDTAEWGDTYHESGVLVLLEGSGSYANKAFENDKAIGARTEILRDAEALRAAFPPGVEACSFEGRSGYINRDGGWAHATQGVKFAMNKVAELGGKVLSGKAVVELLKEDGQTKGVRCEDGSVYPAGLVVLSAGSWSAASFPSLGLGEKCVATGQTVGKIQLTQEEADIYRGNPVYLDLNTGFYVFPPNEQNVVKCAIHAAGYTHATPATEHAPVSSPVFPQASGTDIGTLVPRAALHELGDALRAVFPALARKPWCGTRLCWYTDSPDEDWVIGFHPADGNIMLATAGSGHGYKFLPVIGRLVADAIEGTLPTELVRKFALDRQKNEVPVSRPWSQIRNLDLADLVGPDAIV